MEGSRWIKWWEGRDKQSQSNAISMFVCTSFVSDHQSLYCIFNNFNCFPCYCDLCCVQVGLSSQQVGWKVYRAKNLRPMKMRFSKCWSLGTGSGQWHCAAVGVSEVLSPVSVNLCVHVFCGLAHHSATAGVWNKQALIRLHWPRKKGNHCSFQSTRFSCPYYFSGKAGAPGFLQSIPVVLLPHPSMVAEMVENTP